MGWINSNAAALSAVGSIFMDVATVVIIFFNLNQLRLNNRTLNVDVNFKVFELRKNIHRGIIVFIKNLNLEKGFRAYLFENERGEFQISSELNQLKESIDNYKHLFSARLGLELEFLLLNIEKGIAIEQKISELKSKDASGWSAQDQERLHLLGEHRNEIINSILDFKTDQFLLYLNVANFHKNLMAQDSDNSEKRNMVLKFSTKIWQSVSLVLPKNKLSF